MSLYYKAGVSGDIYFHFSVRSSPRPSHTFTHKCTAVLIFLTVATSVSRRCIFPLYFIKETLTLTYSKWCVSDGPRWLALPPHLKRACLYFTSLTVNRCYFAIFVIVSCPVVECVCCRGTSAPDEWKAGFRKFAPFGYQPKQRHLDWLQSCFGLQTAESKSQTEVKFFIGSSGKNHGIAGQQVIEFMSGRRVEKKPQRDSGRTERNCWCFPRRVRHYIAFLLSQKWPS